MRGQAIDLLIGDAFEDDAAVLRCAAQLARDHADEARECNAFFTGALLDGLARSIERIAATLPVDDAAGGGDAGEHSVRV